MNIIQYSIPFYNNFLIRREVADFVREYCSTRGGFTTGNFNYLNSGDSLLLGTLKEKSITTFSSFKKGLAIQTALVITTLVLSLLFPPLQMARIPLAIVTLSIGYSFYQLNKKVTDISGL